MIRIEITDPESIDKKALRGIARYLLEMSGESIEHKPIDRTIPPETLKALENGKFAVTVEFEEPPTANVQGGECVEPPAITNPFQPPVPSAPVNIPRPAASDVELDTRGFPWHERIHSRTKSKTKEGHWKYLRSVSPRLITEVENEIKGIAPALPVPPPPPPLPVAVPAMDFIGLMQIVTDGIAAGKLFRADITPVISRFGFTSLPLVAEHPDKIPLIAAALTEVIKNAS